MPKEVTAFGKNASLRSHLLDLSCLPILSSHPVPSQPILSLLSIHSILSTLVMIVAHVSLFLHLSFLRSVKIQCFMLVFHGQIGRSLVVEVTLYQVSCYLLLLCLSILSVSLIPVPRLASLHVLIMSRDIGSKSRREDLGRVTMDCSASCRDDSNDTEWSYVSCPLS